MDKPLQNHSGSGDNVGRDKVVTLIPISMDVGTLINILQDSGDSIKTIFDSMNVIKDGASIYNSEITIPIAKKNTINDMTEYFDKYIKKHEAKLHALHSFFQKNDYMIRIESAAENLRTNIFSVDNRKTDKLNVSLLNTIIQDHRKALSKNKDKDIVQLILYYLYRYCFIGEKE